jgi:hypothetical protein
VLSVLALIFSIYVFEKQSKSRREDAIINAWQLIAVPDPVVLRAIRLPDGTVIAQQEPVQRSVGKAPALELLHREGKPLDRVYLAHAWLWPLDLRPIKGRPARLQYADFKGAQLHQSRFDGADMTKACLLGVDFHGANFEKANLQGADFRFSSSMEGVNLRDADVARADFREAKLLTCEQLKSARNWTAAFRDRTLACGQTPPKRGWDARACNFMD